MLTKLNFYAVLSYVGTISANVVRLHSFEFDNFGENILKLRVDFFYFKLVGTILLILYKRPAVGTNGAAFLLQLH